MEHQQAQWWHAIFLLESALGDMQLAGAAHGAAQRAAGHSEVAVANAALELCMCQDVDLLLYAAQLLVALGETVAAERVVQQCCHGSLRPADHSLSVRYLSISPLSTRKRSDRGNRNQNKIKYCTENRHTHSVRYHLIPQDRY